MNKAVYRIVRVYINVYYIYWTDVCLNAVISFESPFSLRLYDIRLLDSHSNSTYHRQFMSFFSIRFSNDQQWICHQTIGFMMKLDSKKHLRNVHHRRVYLISHEWFAVCGFIPNCPVAVFQRKITHTHIIRNMHMHNQLMNSEA